MTSQLDIRFLLRAPHDVLKKRRKERIYSFEGNQSWTDPPSYWDRVVYPAYVEAHSCLFDGGDVEHGRVRTNQGITLLECPDGQVDETIEQCCNALIGAMERRILEKSTC